MWASGEHIVREGTRTSDGSFHFREERTSFELDGAAGVIVIAGCAVIVGGIALLFMGPAGVPVAAVAAKGAAAKVAAGAAIKGGLAKAGVIALA